MNAISGWRKFLVVMFAMGFAFALAWNQRLTADFVTIVSVCVAAFVAGNAWEHNKAGKSA